MPRSPKKGCGCIEIAAENERKNHMFDPNDTVRLQYIGGGSGRSVTYKYRDYWLPTGVVKDIPVELAEKLLAQDVFVCVPDWEEEEDEDLDDEDA